MHRWSHARFIIYGHSLGASVATHISISIINQQHGATCDMDGHALLCANFRGLILESPFSSIHAVTRALDPEKWTQCHYTCPLAWGTSDAVGAITAITALPSTHTSSMLERLRGRHDATHQRADEMVPHGMDEELRDTPHPHPQLSPTSSSSTSHRMWIERKVIVEDVLHENVWQRRQWLREMMRYIGEVHAHCWWIDIDDDGRVGSGWTKESTITS
ncbi:hypothetical protein FIBSPDRAFT_795381 [Athelia psychrophila]|uniref:Uncharacterized protein n=1 Tax=Athelia psychrophila TaxID=1759441 RepID=A0A166E9Z9_9AGAM|nr:hypothetical protein FIBSPDRAFT_795381 [Fibularhizoctonia sp. CBS 109695]